MTGNRTGYGTNTGSSSGSARQEYWIREDQNDTLAGPFDFNTADRQARYMSDDPDRSGLAQMVTYVGGRDGDPVKDTPELRVVYMYIRGKRTLGGRTAQYHSNNDLPPTT